MDSYQQITASHDISKVEIIFCYVCDDGNGRAQLRRSSDGTVLACWSWKRTDLNTAECLVNTRTRLPEAASCAQILVPRQRNVCSPQVQLPSSGLCNMNSTDCDQCRVYRDCQPGKMKKTKKNENRMRREDGGRPYPPTSHSFFSRLCYPRRELVFVILEEN